MSYDPTIWKTPVHDYSRAQDFLARLDLSDRIVRIGEGDGRVELMMAGLEPEDEPGPKYFLVGLTGAQSNRPSQTGPFFAGVTMAKRLGMGLLSFADPGVSNHEEVRLAWYLGGKGANDLPTRIARVIDCVAVKSGAVAILIGGSGGGFSAMNIMRHMTSDAQAVVWNPQTDVSDFLDATVRTYLRCAHPEIFRSDPEAPLPALLACTGVRHDVRDASFRANQSVVYLQNESDWHVERHMQPFFDRGGVWQPIGTKTVFCNERRVIARLGKWGLGHVVPPAAIIRQAVTLITQLHASGARLAEMASEIDSLPGEPLEAIKDEDGCPRVEVQLQSGVVKVVINRDDLPRDANCAFYLLNDRKRIAGTSYSAEFAATLPVTQAATGQLAVRIFVRHGTEQPRSFLVKVPENVEISQRRPATAVDRRDRAETNQTGK